MPSTLQKRCRFLALALLFPFISNAQSNPKPTHVTVKCDTCEVPTPPPPPPPACPPPPPPPCPPPPPPPKAPSCVPCSTSTPEADLPPPPPPPVLSYITSGQGNVYTTDPYGTDIYSGQIRSSVADFGLLLGLWALLPIAIRWI